MSNTSAYFSYDDRNDESYVTFHRGDLFQMLGRFALPPWTDEAGREIGGEIDCAQLASEIIEWERQIEVPYPPANLGCATTDDLLTELRSRIDVDFRSGIPGGLDYRTVDAREIKKRRSELPR